MSSPVPQRRRRAEIEDSGHADNLRDSQRSTPFSDSTKRARTNGYQGSESPEPEPSDADDSPRPRGNRRGPENEIEAVGPGEFQSGAIVRVKLTNFLTYENAEFFPGPNLNMVIGPNGTGKSSLVCAICLGLGWSPKHLGRASEVNEFVKHNMKEAYIEIELQGRRNEAVNHVVRSRIIRDSNSREYWLNNKKTSLKAVQKLTRDLSIQIDNLCQFLPQEKVSDFAALTPVELLYETQRAAAPEEMLDFHSELKKYRKEQKDLEIQNTNDKEQLETLEYRQEALRGEVRKLEERQQIQEQVVFLRKSRPFVEYRTAVAEHRTFKARKKEAQQVLRKLEARLGPTLQSIELKKRQANQLDGAVKERKVALRAAEEAADTCTKEIDKLDANTRDYELKADAEKKVDQEKKKEILKLQRKLTDLEARLNDEPVVFNAADYNEKIRAKEHDIRDLKAELQDAGDRSRELRVLAEENRREEQSATQQLANFDTQEGQQMSKLENASKDTAVAWKWVQENMESFEKEVYGPPVISCSLKDQNYADVVEAALGRQDFLAITAQTQADHKMLSDHLLGTMRLADITLRKNDDASVPNHPNISQNDMRDLGLEGWALDFIDGPTQVLAMLCYSARIHRTAIGLRDSSENQHNMIVNNGVVSTWITGKTSSRVSKRAEYGAHAISTSTKAVRPGQYWTDQPVDTTAKQKIQQKIQQIEAEFAGLKSQIRPVRENMEKFKSKILDLEAETKTIKEEKAKLQKLQGEQKALPDKIQREQESISRKNDERADIHAQIDRINNQHSLCVLRKATKSLEYKEKVEAIRLRHEELLEAEIRLIEAHSDVESLTERNSGIVRRQEQERQRVKEIEDESKIVTDRAKKALHVIEELNAKEDQETRDRLASLPEDLTMEAVELDIAAEESKLDYIHANNPNAIAQFEKFQVSVDKLKAKVTEADARLEKLQTRITKVRGKWEPELDKLIAEISDAFAYNFEQIGCAGEVGVEKTEDFEDWAIKIKVKFRENEQLQVLDKHRQSGGERSVATIFYLMALQSLARSPFRVVDEINQGMDPRNERMVHERMVEIACKEHTSQYFLITPKLLTGLQYDRRMKILCIASGEYMPQDHRQLDVTKIIGLRRAIVGAA